MLVSLRAAAAVAVLLAGSGAATAMVIDRPDRMTAEEYAAAHAGGDLGAVLARFAASGELICGGWAVGSAQLVARPDVVVLTQHELYDLDWNVRDLSACVVRFTLAPGFTVETPLADDMVAARGYESFDGWRTQADDWAILALPQPVFGVTPYAVDWSGRQPPSLYLDAALMTAPQADFFTTLADGTRAFPRSFARGCGLREILHDPDDMAREYWTTTCDAAPGASGGAMLDLTTGTPTFWALMSAVSEPMEDLLAALAPGGLGQNARPFSGEDWFSVAVPVSAGTPFQAALAAVVAERAAARLVVAGH